MTIIYIYLTIISLLLLINLILKITILINKKDNINEENKDFVYKKKEKREYIEVFNDNEEVGNNDEQDGDNPIIFKKKE